MRLPFATICMAIAAFRACVGSYAAPFRSIIKPPRFLLDVATKRHLRSDELAPDNEERVEFSFDLNKLPGEEEIVGETSESLGTEIKELQLLKEREQLVKSVASEKMELFTLLNDWNQVSMLFKKELELENAETEEFKTLLDGGKRNARTLPGEMQENLDELLDGWKVPDEWIKSETESSTKDLRAWLERMI